VIEEQPGIEVIEQAHAQDCLTFAHAQEFAAHIHSPVATSTLSAHAGLDGNALARHIEDIAGPTHQIAEAPTRDIFRKLDALLSKAGFTRADVRDLLVYVTDEEAAKSATEIASTAAVASSSATGVPRVCPQCPHRLAGHAGRPCAQAHPGRRLGPGLRRTGLGAREDERQAVLRIRADRRRHRGSEEQAARFGMQAEEKAAGDVTAEAEDPDYLEAMSYAMPPNGGCGIGIDRLAMVLTGHDTIRDVILFPALRERE